MGPRAAKLADIDKFVNNRVAVALSLSTLHAMLMPLTEITESLPLRKRLDPSARRTQLLDHAVTAFAASGIERAVHADVAGLAGVSTPTVFKYFPTREALVNAVFDKIEVTVTELIDHIPVGARLTVEAMMMRMSTALDRLCKTQPDLMKVALAWSVAFSSVRERYVRFQEKKLDMLHARLDSSDRGRSDARILLACALLYIRMNFDGTSDETRRHYIGRLTELWASAPEG